MAFFTEPSERQLPKSDMRKARLAMFAGIFSFVLFPVEILLVRMGIRNAWLVLPLIPALCLATYAALIGIRALRLKPAGNDPVLGLGIAATLLGVFSLLFWVIQVPLLSNIALPAIERAEEESPDPPGLAESKQQMRLLVRHTKSFYREYDRLPVKLEELVEKGMIRADLLYDPRGFRRDVPAYRLVLTNMPPMSVWSETPAVESRYSDEHGVRLFCTLDETFVPIPPDRVP